MFITMEGVPPAPSGERSELLLNIRRNPTPYNKDRARPDVTSAKTEDLGLTEHSEGPSQGTKATFNFGADSGWK